MCNCILIKPIKIFSNIINDFIGSTIIFFTKPNSNESSLFIPFIWIELLSLFFMFFGKYCHFLYIDYIYNYFFDNNHNSIIYSIFLKIGVFLLANSILMFILLLYMLIYDITNIYTTL